MSWFRRPPTPTAPPVPAQRHREEDHRTERTTEEMARVVGELSVLVSRLEQAVAIVEDDKRKQPAKKGTKGGGQH